MEIAIIAGTSIVRTTKVSKITEEAIIKPTILRTSISENRRPLKATAIMIPAAVIMLPVSYTAFTIEAVVENIFFRYSAIRHIRNRSTTHTRAQNIIIQGPWNISLAGGIITMRYHNPRPTQHR